MTRTLEAQASLLDDRIDTLKRDAAKHPPMKQVFEIVGAILALVRVSPLTLRPSFISDALAMARSGKDDCSRRVCAAF